MGWCLAFYVQVTRVLCNIAVACGCTIVSSHAVPLSAPSQGFELIQGLSLPSCKQSPCLFSFQYVYFQPLPWLLITSIELSCPFPHCFVVSA